MTQVNDDETFVFGEFLLGAAGFGARTQVCCKWRLSRKIVNTDRAKRFRCLDLLLRIVPGSSGPSITKGKASLSSYPDATESALGVLIQAILRTRAEFVGGNEVFTKVILSANDGYLSRSDILSVRIQQSEWFDDVVIFWPWNRRLPAFYRQSTSDLKALMLSSLGALVVKEHFTRSQEDSMRLQEDLEMRLSLDLVLTNRPAAYRLALVAGRTICDPERGTFRSGDFLESAKALRVTVTILDVLGHWMQGTTYEDLRAGFVPVDLSIPAGLSQRIAEAAKSLVLDSIVTFTDKYIVPTIEAAEILGLPTEPLCGAPGYATTHFWLMGVLLVTSLMG